MQIVTAELEPGLAGAFACVHARQDGKHSRSRTSVHMRFSYAVTDRNPSLRSVVSAVCAVTSGTVNITCQKGTGWPANSLTVDVSATAGAEGCKNTTTLSNAITINTRPQVSVTAVEPTVNDCASGNSRNFTFTVTGLGSQGTPTYTPTWTVNPSSTPGLTTDCSAFSGKKGACDSWEILKWPRRA